MGLWNETCFLSGLSIYDEPCRVIFLQSNLYDGATPGGGFTGVTDCWEPVSSPLPGSYGGYGVSCLKKDDPIVRWTREGLAELLGEPGLDLDHLQERLCETCAGVDPVRVPQRERCGLVEDAPSVLGMVYVREDAWEAVLGTSNTREAWHVAATKYYRDLLQMGSAADSFQDDTAELFHAAMMHIAQDLCVPEWIRAALREAACASRPYEEVAPLLRASADLVCVGEILRSVRRPWMPMPGKGSQEENAASVFSYARAIASLKPS